MSEELQQKVDDVAWNDTGLPAAHMSEEATAMEAWCKHGSWAICRGCHSVQPRHLKEIDLRWVGLPSISKCCKNCQKPEEKQTWIPKPVDVPKALRELPWSVTEALRLVDIDAGQVWQSDVGCRFHRGDSIPVG
eukprot:2853588-Amphidinium_carterae.3